MLPGLRGATRRLLTPARTMCTYSERMDKLGKPVSPHITIYAWPTIAISSVFMRTTGILLSIGTAGIGLLSLPNSQLPVDVAQGFASSSFAAPAKFLVAFPLTYHWFGAIRHAVWDLKAWGFSNQMMLQSSYGLAGLSIAFSLAATTVSLPPKNVAKKM